MSSDSASSFMDDGVQYSDYNMGAPPCLSGMGTKYCCAPS